MTILIATRAAVYPGSYADLGERTRTFALTGPAPGWRVAVIALTFATGSPGSAHRNASNRRSRISVRRVAPADDEQLSAAC